MIHTDQLGETHVHTISSGLNTRNTSRDCGPSRGDIHKGVHFGLLGTLSGEKIGCALCSSCWDEPVYSGANLDILRALIGWKLAET